MSETMESVEGVHIGANGGKVWGYPKPKKHTPAVTVFVPDTKFGFLKVARHYDVPDFIITSLFLGLISAGLSALGYLLLWFFVDDAPIIFFALVAVLFSAAGCLFRRQNDAPNDYRFDVLAFFMFLALSYAAYPFTLKIQNERVKSESEYTLYEQEYGYDDISVPLGKPIGTAVNSDGETIEIGVYTYKGQNILFETPEQLDEKIAEVDAGIFLKGETSE